EKDREAKRQAAARLLVALLDVLPTAEERKQREEDLKKPPEQRADPFASPAYRQALNAVGARHLARALDEQARSLLAMAAHVSAGRDQERMLFAEHHQAPLNPLASREHELRDHLDQLEVKREQVKTQAQRAEQQEQNVVRLTEELKKSQDATAKELARLADQQRRLFEVRV